VNLSAEVLNRVRRALPRCALAVALVAACGQPPVTIDTVTLASNPNSALAERVAVSTHGASTAHVVWWAGDGVQHETPPTPVPASGSVTLDVLGLAASTAYEAQVVAEASGATTRSATSSFTTGPLPSALAGVHLEVSGTPPDSDVLVDLLNDKSPGALVAFDGAGTVRWYRLFDGTDPVVEAKQLPSGNYLAFVGPTKFASSGGSYMEVTPAGDFVHAYASAPPLAPDDHEGLLTAEAMSDERVHLLGFDAQTVGNYLVSFRNLDSIFVIDSHTGDVLWSLGGKRSDFTFVGVPLNGFSGQDCARLLPNGDILLLDNGSLHDPPMTRAAEYALDTAAHTARLVWEFRPPEPVFNAFTGSALRDAAGTTWVGLSYPGVIYRAAADGTVMWKATLAAGGQPPLFYRAVPVRSLYQYLPP